MKRVGVNAGKFLLKMSSGAVKKSGKILHSREIVILSVIFYRTKFEDLVSITHEKQDSKPQRALKGIY